MTVPKQIWVLPEIDPESGEINKPGLGLLSEAKDIAEKVGGFVTAVVLAAEKADYSTVFSRYGIDEVLVFIDPLLINYSADAGAAALLPRLRQDKPWLFLLGDSLVGRELAPRLATPLESGMVSDCASMDFSNPECPVFYRYVYGDQLFQEVSVPENGSIFITMDSRVLSDLPVSQAGSVRTVEIEPKISANVIRTRHVDFIPSDFRTVDVSEADVIVSAGMGAVADDIFPLVEELANLIEGTIGTTRPVIDEGIIPRERMIGQTGKVVSPDFYLALGISGATHHVGGIQDSRRIASINLDAQAPVFSNSDFGVVADLREVLPTLIRKVRQAREDGKIL